MEFKIEKLDISKEAISKLLCYDWPGNVRELENVIQHAVIFCDNKIIIPEDIVIGDGVDKIQIDLLPYRVARNKVIEEFEQNYLEKLLVQNRGNVSIAAKKAQKCRGDLYRLIDKHGIDVDEFKYGLV